MTRVRVDMNLCQSNGQCELAAPEIFRFGNGDVLRWKEEEDDPLVRQKTLEAVEASPMQAIRVED